MCHDEPFHNEFIRSVCMRLRFFFLCIFPPYYGRRFGVRFCYYRYSFPSH
ncbi:MAG: hypothetical protein IJ237_05430 [Oscillospiraceae bacterium]|nr:hypothetical protein [Oscillospiraceae bacterium]